MTDSKTMTHFGHTKIPLAEKAPRVQGVFNSVAARYDVMNDLMSGGLHRLWKHAMMDWLAPRPATRLLDVAGGTGDIAFRYIDRAPGSEAVLLDLTHAMLVEGQKRAQARADRAAFSFVTGDAMRLPLVDNSFDCYTIAFGIRNVAEPQQALAEARRVLRPGGRLMILEFGHVAPDFLAWAYDRYSYNIIPALGQAVTGDRDSYQYLVESIRAFSSQHELQDMIAQAGFDQVKLREITLGVACLHSAWVL